MADGDPLDSPRNQEMLRRLSALNPGVLAEIYLRQKIELAQPPEGWFVFGTHILPEHRDLKLEFWGTAEDGMPFWERPVDG